MTEQEKKYEEYGGKPYGKIKCPFFTKQSRVTDLKHPTICSKCWALYDYNCYYPRFFDCDQYGEMLKTIKPEYLRSIIEALREQKDFEITSGLSEKPPETSRKGKLRSIGTVDIGDIIVNVFTDNDNVEIAFIVDGNSEYDVGINILREDDFDD